VLPTSGLAPDTHFLHLPLAVPVSGMIDALPFSGPSRLLDPDFSSSIAAIRWQICTLCFLFRLSEAAGTLWWTAVSRALWDPASRKICYVKTGTQRRGDPILPTAAMPPKFPLAEHAAVVQLPHESRIGPPYRLQCAVFSKWQAR